jgi:deoxycytidylate deaminase
MKLIDISHRLSKRNSHQHPTNYLSFCASPNEMYEAKLAKSVNRERLAEIPDWIEYYINMCFEVAKRSKDAQTQCGCIITDKSNHIMSTGYNSFARGLNDAYLPNVRPEKYKWFNPNHAEQNALNNRTTNFWAYSEGLRAYITGKPCFNCLNALWGSNINEIYYGNRLAVMVQDDTDEAYDYFISSLPIQVYEVQLGE